jgi:hypothetical protein
MSAQPTNNHANNNGTDIPSVTLPNSMSFYKLIEESRWLYQVDFNLYYCFSFTVFI